MGGRRGGGITENLLCFYVNTIFISQLPNNQNSLKGIFKQDDRNKYTRENNRNIGRIKSPLDLIIMKSFIENEVEGNGN